MKVSIFGIGYVGAVTAGCLNARGHSIVCVDVNEDKVSAIAEGRSPIVEPGLNALLSAGVQRGEILATTDHVAAVHSTDLSIVCVGTPSLESGRLNLAYVNAVYGRIVDVLESKGGRHVIVIRSTMLPGSLRTLVEGTRPKRVRSAGVEVCFCPEFLREGTAIRDYNDPALSVYGTVSGNDCPELEALMDGTQRISLESAELLKYACNYWHAVKVVFGNEIGRLSKFLHEDGVQLMKIFCQDQVLNVSPHYLRPGNPFGGSCLPKDVSALCSFARQEGISLPLLESVMGSNEAHLDHLLKLITESGLRSVLIAGLSFKQHTDDLRGSPMVAVAETLIGKGYHVEIFDSNLDVSLLTGSNQSEIERRLPHLASRLTGNVETAISQNRLIVIAQDILPVESLKSLTTPEHVILDTVGLPQLSALNCCYTGVCWDEPG